MWIHLKLEVEHIFVVYPAACEADVHSFSCALTIVYVSVFEMIVFFSTSRYKFILILIL